MKKLNEFWKRPFKLSKDSLWNAGQFVFYFERPQTEDDVYGIPRGNVHGLETHIFKHVREFMTKIEVEDFVQRAKDAIKDMGITHVWQGKGRKEDPLSLDQVADMNLPPDQWENTRGLTGLKRIPVEKLSQKHIFNGLAWIATKVVLGRELSSNEKWFYEFSSEIRDIYTNRMDKFSMLQYGAVDVADENFSSSKDLFEKLKELYLNSKEISFEMTRDDGVYRVTYNLATFVYTSIKIDTGEKGTFFRFEKRRTRRTLRQALIKWATSGTNSINDEYSYLRELCGEAMKPGPLPEWGEWGILNRYDKEGKPTGAPIPYVEELNEVKTLRKYIRNILLTEGMKFNEDLALIKVEGGYSVSRYATTWLLIKDNRQGPFNYEWADENIVAMAVTDDGLVTRCHDAVEIKRMAALEGYGPTMYDLLMEVLDRPIINDRSSVSPEAYAVMVRYMGRPDVKKMLMDDVFDEVTYPRTETDEDDCEPGSRRKYTRGVLVRDASPPLEDPGDLYHLEWDEDPLSYAYTKDITPRGNEIEQNGKDWLQETGVRLSLIDRWAHQFFTEIFE